MLFVLVLGTSMPLQAQPPANYYNATAGKTCAALKTELFNIISANHVPLTYTPGVWNAVNAMDIKRNDANTANVIWDIYSDNPTGPDPYTFTPVTDQCGSYSGEGDCYNREHSFPQAWFVAGTLPMMTDLNHIFPTDGFVNGRHDNFPYSEVGTATWTSQTGNKLGSNSFPGFTGTVFEPINEYKGDIARAMLYMVTRYENNMVAWRTNANADNILSGNTYPSLDNWYIQLMFKWHNQDPVSAKERARNDSIFRYQGNRNPYIDRPEFVSLVWQCTGLIPVTLIDFKAQARGNNVMLTWYATQETDFRQYEIERSTDGRRFSQIGTVAGRNLTNYQFEDGDVPLNRQVFYRLKMVDIDGKFKYSKTVSLRVRQSASAMRLMPNPAFDQLAIRLERPLQGTATLQIRDMAGKLLSSAPINHAMQLNQVDVQTLAAGRYEVILITPEQVLRASLLKAK